MVKCLYAETSGFMFNVHSHVGTGMPNQLDDVEFCRLAYYVMRKLGPTSNPKPTSSPPAPSVPISTRRSGRIRPIRAAPRTVVSAL